MPIRINGEIRLTEKLLTLSIVTALALTGCGGPSDAEKRAARERKDKAAAAAAEKKANAEKQVAHDACVAQLQPFLNALREINSRLSIGLNNSDYSSRIGDARVAYDDIDVDGLNTISPVCLDAAARLENALNKFVEVKGVWDQCIDDYDCDFSTGEANRKAQAGWQKAGTAITNAEAKIDGMVPPK